MKQLLLFPLLFLALPAFSQGTLVNLRKPGICPNATAALPQIPVYNGGLLPTCYALGTGLTLNTATLTITAAGGTPAASQRTMLEVIDLSKVTVTTLGDGSIHYGYQTSRTPVLGSPVTVLFTSRDPATGLIRDSPTPVIVASDGTKVLNLTLTAIPQTGDSVAITYPTVEP